MFIYSLYKCRDFNLDCSSRLQSRKDIFPSFDPYFSFNDLDTDMFTFIYWLFNGLYLLGKCISCDHMGLEMRFQCITIGQEHIPVTCVLFRDRKF